jgi:hypothetical protein
LQAGWIGQRKYGLHGIVLQTIPYSYLRNLRGTKTPSLHRRERVFDFTKVRNISRKVVIEDDPAKIDQYLAKLHATVTRKLDVSRTPSAPHRVQSERRLSRRNL